MTREEFINEMDKLNESVANCNDSIRLIRNMLDILRKSTVSDDLAMNSMLSTIDKTVSDTLEIKIKEFNSKIKRLCVECVSLDDTEKPKVRSRSASAGAGRNRKKKSSAKKFGEVDKGEQFDSETRQADIDMETLFENAEE